MDITAKKKEEGSEINAETNKDHSSDLQKYFIQTQKTQNFVSIKKGVSKAVQKGRVTIANANRQYQKSGTPLKDGGTDLLATVSHYLSNNQFELKLKKPVATSGLYLLFLIDSSGSMIKDQRIGYIKGLIEQTIALHEHKKIQYGAIALRQAEAEILTPFTSKGQEFLQAVTQLESGGKTNMKAGFETIHKMVKANLFPQLKLYIFTDGKINAGALEQPFKAATSYYKTYLKSIQETTVVDTENYFVKLGLSEKLARQIGAKYLQL